MTRVADLLAELVRMQTQQGGGDERAFCEHLAPMLRARGAERVEIGSGKRTDGSPGAWVFATWGTPRRVINAHVDTVPANSGWSRDPWTPAIEGGKLYGLGSADTKGAIAATLVALDSAKPNDFGVLFSGDEEAGSRILTQFLSTPTDIKEVIVCEPTKRVAGVAHRGVLSQKALLTGPGGHSSMADHLPKPIARLARLAVAIDDSAARRVNDGPTGMTGTCLNVASLSGGIAFNVIAARAELEWSLRPYPGFDRADWERELAGLVEGSGIVVETTIDHPPFAARPGATLAQVVAPFAQSVGPLHFWTEAALYAEHGIDAVVIGPGDIAQAHAADEWVTLEDLDWAVEMLRATM